MSTEKSTDSNESLEILLDRVKEWIGESRDAAVARALNVSRSSISTWRTRGTVPYGEFVRWGERNCVSMDWLFYGGSPKTYEDVLVDSPSGDYLKLPVDMELLEISIEAATMCMEMRKVSLSPEKHAKLISLIYELYMDEDEPKVDTAKIIRLVDLAS